MAKYQMPDAISGDTYDGVRFTMFLNGSPLNLTSASIAMKVFPFKYPVFYKTSGSINTMTIISASAGIFEFDKQVLDIEPGEHQYEITFYLQDGSIKTYISGSWLITEN